MARKLKITENENGQKGIAVVYIADNLKRIWADSTDKRLIKVTQGRFVRVRHRLQKVCDLLRGFLGNNLGIYTR